jgi:Restriction Enzyme Adenine Methylase Associated/Domain of unknown function (DUF4357)
MGMKDRSQGGKAALADRKGEPVSNSGLKELIESGRLPVGTKLRLNRRDHTTTATVVQGGIKVGKKVYASPSGAASAITGGSINGWAVWRTEDGQPLATLRD